jgi:23S rRNA (pseudouridine1915-N3)-methyltransferase
VAGPLVVATVGRTRRGPLAELERDFSARIERLAPLERVVVPAGRQRRAADRRSAESRALAGALPAAPDAVLLEVSGRSMGSERFRERVVRWREQNGATFVVGGPDGLDPAPFPRAAETLSLGPMTLPHELALVVLLEQLYRALAAESGHPYARH